MTDYLRGVNLPTFQYMTSAPTNYEMIDAQASLTYLKGRGVDIARIPIPWGRVQQSLGAAFDSTYFPKLQTLVSRCSTAGIKVVLDLHCNGGYKAGVGGDRFSASAYNAVFYDGASGSALGSCSQITSAQFVNFWTRIETAFGADTNVVAYDLVNEPFTGTGPNGDKIPQSTYRAFQQAAVTALRNAGSTKDIWIEGTNSSQPQGWAAREGNPWITDPANKIVYSFHTYPLSNGNGNGEYTTSDSNTANFLARIDEFEAWRSAHGVRASCGETGWPSQQHGAPSTYASYNTLAGQWLSKADLYGYTVTIWQAHAAQIEGFNMYDHGAGNSFTTPTPVLDHANTNASTYEAHPSSSSSSFTETADGTIVPTNQSSITDSLGNVWAIDGSAKITVNGAEDNTTANVVQLDYVNHLVYQKNAAGGWWYKASPTDTWHATSDPLPPVAPLRRIVGVSRSAIARTVNPAGRLPGLGGGGI